MPSLKCRKDLLGRRPARPGELDVNACVLQRTRCPKVRRVIAIMAQYPVPQDPFVLVRHMSWTHLMLHQPLLPHFDRRYISGTCEEHDAGALVGNRPDVEWIRDLVHGAIFSGRLRVPCPWNCG